MKQEEFARERRQRLPPGVDKHECEQRGREVRRKDCRCSPAPQAERVTSDVEAPGESRSRVRDACQENEPRDRKVEVLPENVVVYQKRMIEDDGQNGDAF